MKALHCTAFVLVIIGGINWLLVAFNWNLVDAIFGAGSTLSMIVYVLVGLSALLLIFTHKSSCKMCVKSGSMPPQM
ncbi:MAG: DUF378 domain-containing protein [Patescibacteria group bacterium]|nr:DUF378 domain-containing protein [Patescibacteria group bacterium]MDE2172701.1 DUF378 domain-containing protein [Patescibacteria group bacterium]